LPEIVIGKRLWQNLLAAARKRRQRAEVLAETALEEFLQRVADEDLLERSERSARRARFPIGESEAVVRKWRHNRKGI